MLPEELEKIINVFDFSNFKVDDDFILDNCNNVEYNKIIVNYYKKMLDEGSSELKKFGSFIPKSKIYDLEHCNKYWDINIYHSNRIKDFVGAYTCKDKFCNNCKKLKQAVRMSRYIPEIEKYRDNLYHIVFTVPNMIGKDLHFSLKKMKKAFRDLMRIIRGNYRCFIDFSRYGWLGNIRSLEITFVEDLYHPHFHCGFVFKNLELDKKYTNCYSYSNKSDKIRKFSEFEIILQKLWYMLYNNISITKENYDKIDVGYSVMCDKFRDNDYVELFKYMTKATSEKDKLLTYENFKTLYWSTYRIKQIQGYGCFYMIKDDDITQEEIDKVYADIQFFLDSDECPENKAINPKDLLYDKDYLLISRKKIYQYLKLTKNQKS